MFIRYHHNYQNLYIDKNEKKIVFYGLPPSVCQYIYIYIFIYLFIKLFSQAFPIKDTLKRFSTNCFL